MAEAPRERLLVFVIAYYAESTLTRVLERIPRAIFERFDTTILVVDDASEDRTFEIGIEYMQHHPTIAMKVLRNTRNQGYGGNQKVGYSYAIAEGFDHVAMLHGDAQYAPEELPRLLEPLVNGSADAVFGSRMLERFQSLKGGMPLYKYAGNRVLTKIQNTLLGTAFSEFHSGYRIYSVAALRKIPFHLNTNDFHFDTEIIIQLLHLGARIVELPIPTYYGDEICRVNGMKYAKDVLLATTRSALHKAGLLYQRRFDTQPTGNEHYDLKLGYASSHSYALEAVAAGSRVMDLGAGPGAMARELVKKGCQVTLVDKHPARVTHPDIRRVEQDLDQTLAFDVADYDYLLLLDVIEHLQSPERFLDELRAKFDYQPKTLIITTPNIAFIVQRLMLALGEFNYGKAGILDLTHTRLFTFRSVLQALDDAGFRIRRVRGVPAPFPKAIGDNPLSRALLALNERLIPLSPSLFSYQIYIEAESTPDVRFVLHDTRTRSAAPPPLGVSNATRNDIN